MEEGSGTQSLPKAFKSTTKTIAMRKKRYTSESRGNPD